MENNITASFDDKKEWLKKDSRNVLVLMSGGVDSSAAALILQNDGWNVAGLTMVISDDESACGSAAEVCSSLGVPHFSVNIKCEFKARVIDLFRSEYRAGRTPNPCADCNERVKFGLLCDLAHEAWGGNFHVATGHYARIIRTHGGTYLARAANIKKDQSYFLSGLKRELIEKMLLPLGSFVMKDETRSLVRAAGLPVAERPESMEICFAGEEDYRHIMESASVPGDIVGINGKVIGRHNGIINYTVGQRKGLGIASKDPLYVVSIRRRDNVIVAAGREDAFASVVKGERLNVLAQEYLDASVPRFGKVRSQGEPQPCAAVSADGGRILVEFAKPIFAPAPGQRLVLYTADGVVIAGAVISPLE